MYFNELYINFNLNLQKNKYMSSVKNLKKDINYILSDVIEECYLWQLQQDDVKKADKAEKIIDESISTFDNLIEKVNQKSVENKKSHFKGIQKELKEKVAKLFVKLEKL